MKTDNGTPMNQITAKNDGNTNRPGEARHPNTVRFYTFGTSSSRSSIRDHNTYTGFILQQLSNLHGLD
ncbi:hypothetical protein GOBAR_DD36956 [Gossypium barbadense]|nr:hypothetical protein GOBAR_DD36956 [Gossypium barbadense]